MHTGWVEDERTKNALGQEDIDIRVSLFRCRCNARLFCPNVLIGLAGCILQPGIMGLQERCALWRLFSWWWHPSRQTQALQLQEHHQCQQQLSATQYTPHPQLSKQLDYQQRYNTTRNKYQKAQTTNKRLFKMLPCNCNFTYIYLD